MEENDSIIEKKQDYLRNEIIEKGFSPDDFINYLTKLKGENAYDLNEWSLDELQKVVQQYKASQNPEKQEEQKVEQKEEIKEEIKKELNEEIKDEKKEEQKEEGKNEIPEESNDEFIGGDGEDLWGNKIDPKSRPANCIINCKKLEPYEIIKKRDILKVYITNVEIKKDGIFSSSYNEFTIKNELLNKHFKRKMDDFIWIKNKLTTFYPNIFIPPLPKFKVKKEEKYIQRKIYYLHSFLNYIINNDILLSAQIFQDFISLSQENFKNTKNFFEKKIPPKGIEEIITTDGNLNITILPEKDKKAYDINVEIQKKNDLYHKLNVNLKEGIHLLFQIKQKFLNISNIFEDLSKFYSKSTIIKNDRTNLNFIKLKDIFINCADEYEKKMNYFEVHIRRFFKMIKKEINEFSYLYKNYDNARTTFIDVTERENVVIDDNIKNLKKYFGFTLNVVYDEYQKLNKVHNLRIKEHFSKPSKYLNM